MWDSFLALSFGSSVVRLRLFNHCWTGGDDRNAPQNRWLREAAELKLPIICFLGIKPGLYQQTFPAFLTDWKAADLQVRIVFTPAIGATTSSFPTDPEDRRYAIRLVNERLQAQFREAVIEAYGGQSAIPSWPSPCSSMRNTSYPTRTRSWVSPSCPMACPSRRSTTRPVRPKTLSSWMPMG